MPSSRFVDVIYTHTEGEPTCIVHGGVPYPFGTDIHEKRRYLELHYNWLRRALICEPRGHRDMFGVFVTPPASADTHAGTIWMDSDEFRHICGHGTIALGMVMVSCGMVPVDGNPVRLGFETTAGPIAVEVGLRDGTPEWCRFECIPAQVVAQGLALDLPEIGVTEADVVKMGHSHLVCVRWAREAKPIDPENGSFFSRTGILVQKLAWQKLKGGHDIPEHAGVAFYHQPTHPDALYRNVVVFGNGKLDRSPGGTGTCAMMAAFEARGRIRIGQTIRSEGLLGGGTFEGCLVRETRVNGARAVVGTVKGSARITGYAKWLIDREDPVGSGFVVL